MRRALACALWLLALTAPTAALAQYESDAGYTACPQRGDTWETFRARWPIWVRDASDRLVDTPMSYVVQSVGGERVLIATGAIGGNESQNLRMQIEAAGGVSEVWFNSPGGSSPQGLLMAQVLRSYGLITRVRSGYACISACTTAFLGGVLRYVEPGGAYGVHMFSAFRAIGAQSSTLQTEQDSAMHANDYSQLLVRMGVSLRWNDYTFRTPHLCVNYLSRSVMRDLNVINAQ